MTSLNIRYHDATGTVSIAGGDTAATGTGTAWNATVRPGDLLLIGGVAGLVAEVTSATRLILLTPWPGPNVADAACAVLFTSPSRYDALEMPAAIARLIDAGRAAAARAETYAVIAVQNAPPVTPVLDDMYLVGAAPSGGWSGRAGHLAQWSGSGWLYIAPRAGLWAHDLATGALLACTGTAWRPLIETISTALAAAIDATRASAAAAGIEAASATASAAAASASRDAAEESAGDAAASRDEAAADAAIAGSSAADAAAGAASAATMAGAAAASASEASAGKTAAAVSAAAAAASANDSATSAATATSRAAAAAASAAAASASAAGAADSRTAAALSATQAATSATGAAASAATASARAGEAAASRDEAAASAAIAAGLSYSMAIYNSAGVSTGIYYLCRATRSAGTHGRLHAEVISGSAGASVSFWITVNGALAFGPRTVVLGTPLILTSLALVIPAGARIDVEIISAPGVTEFFLEIAR